MALRARRQLLVWTAIPLLVGQVGCAARGVHGPAPEEAAGVREAEQTRCREFARRVETDRYRNVKERSVLGPAILTMVSIPLTVAGLATIPFGGTPPLGMIESAGRWTEENVQHNRVIREGRKATYEQAMTDCLQPTTLEETLGPDHPDVARSLRTLANGHVSLREYADPEALFMNGPG